MSNYKRIEALAMLGRARVVALDMARGACMVRLLPPSGGIVGWPRNVVALRRIPYIAARGMRGLIGS